MAVSTQRPSACWCDLAQGCAEDLHERSKAVPHTQRHVSLLFGACLIHVLLVTHAKATKRDFVNKLELAICLSVKAAGPRGCVYSVELYWYPFSPAGMQILCSGGCPRCTDISPSGQRLKPACPPLLLTLMHSKSSLSRVCDQFFLLIPGSDPDMSLTRSQHLCLYAW